MRWAVSMLRDQRRVVWSATAVAVLTLAIPFYLVLQPWLSSASANGKGKRLQALPELAEGLPATLVSQAQQLGVIEASCVDSAWMMVTLQDGLTREASAHCRPLVPDAGELSMHWRVEFGAASKPTRVFVAADDLPEAALPQLIEQLEAMLAAVRRGKAIEAHLREWREEPR